MKQLLVLIGCIFLTASSMQAQDFWFGLKGGGTLGFQQGSGSARGTLLATNLAFFLETPDEDRSSGSLYAQLGWHQRGSSQRSFYTNNNVRFSGRRFVYNNASLQIGAKKFFRGPWYYSMGIRGEYTFHTSLKKIQEEFSSPYFPLPEFTRKFTGGISAAGGTQFELAELYGIAFELSVHQDFLNQYISPRIDNIINPYTNNVISISERKFRNTSLEFTVAFRFLRKVEYID